MPLAPPSPPTAPIKALRYFEAAARHGSFQKAAEELSVTPGAVAQQVKKLEDWVGAQLFQRHAQGVTLLPLARQALPELTAAFDRLGRAAQTLRLGGGVGSPGRHIRIAALPAVAQLWLAPRLSQIGAALPGVEFSIHALEARPSPRRDAYDLAIFPVPPDQVVDEGLDVLCENQMLPVSAPNVADQISTPEDLASANLLHDSAWAEDWSTWARSADLQTIDPTAGPSYSLYSMAVERCIAGDGILIGHTALLSRPLAQRRLVALFPDRAIAGWPLCLIGGSACTTDPLADVIAAIRACA